VGGLVLLAFTGSGGPGTDVVAHLAGFSVGALFGAAVASRSVGRALNRVPQWLTGAIALVSMTVAWCCALVS
jgi:membrane associated rhomboid family serine protease